MDSTLATGEVSDAIDVDGDGVSDFTGWGEDYSAAKDDADFGCLFEVGLAMWEDSALDGEGLADDMGLIGEAIESYLAAGGDPADLGYDSIADMVSASFDGTLDDGSAWTDMLNFLGNAAASDPTAFADWVDPSAYTDMYDDSFVTFEAVHSFYEENIAYGGLRTTAEALTKHQEADDETSLDCDSIKNGDVDPSAFIAPFLAADDLEEFTNTYTGDGFFVYVGLM
ncbi:MAG: hypothetical protein HYU99_05760, partial [Deltaproteobacteria bacterium]|nr:hypothetical protein [Deltaproteobacteria bacterium]